MMGKQTLIFIVCAMSVIAGSVTCAEDGCDLGNQDVQAALNLYKQKESLDYPRIIQLLEQAKEKCPTWSAPSRYLGDIMTEQKKYSDAIDYYRQAVKINEKDFEAYLYLGDIYNIKDQPIHALRYYYKGKKVLEGDIHLKAENIGLLQEYQKKCIALEKDHIYRDETILASHLDVRSAVKLGVRPVIDTYIEFDTGRAETKEDWKAQLDTVAEVLRSPRMEAYSVIIQGHTDVRGSADKNYKLSVNRAKVVEQYLLNSGVSSSSVFEAEGKGETRTLPRQEGETEKKWHRRNRRVVFISCGKGESKAECLRRAGAN
ncbi:OmpA family protein [Desulfobacterales bacterium HSG2]|nr:OmpA family protein [Desulfobacterales bacterium HSG2]